MARLNTANELFRRLTKLQVVRINSTATAGATVGQAFTAGATSITASNTFGTAAQALIVYTPGGTELSQSTTATTTAIAALQWPINQTYATADGTALIYQATSITLGHLTQDGVTVNPSYSQTAIFSAIQDTPLAYIGQQGEISASFNLRGFNPENWATAFGVAESRVQGSGTASAPYQVWLGGTRFGEQSLQCFRFIGANLAGDIVFVEINDAKAEASGQSQLASNGETIIPITVKGTSCTIRTGTSLSAV